MCKLTNNIESAYIRGGEGDRSDIDFLCEHLKTGCDSCIKEMQRVDAAHNNDLPLSFAHIGLTLAFMALLFTMVGIGAALTPVIMPLGGLAILLHILRRMKKIS